MTAIASLAMVNLDCADPRALAEFYHQVLDLPITHSEDAYAMIGDGVTNVGFGRVEGYRPPNWPDTDSSKRYHLDLYADDLDEAEARCVKLGAVRPEFQPGGDRWRVLLDPAGHPFCVCRRPGDSAS
ncbi:VOC family protein [Actinoallomurus sp. CA-150999]|uniref:VOC family protein n=1 Tax=Actinoallomurus sp. CA-150999 TaxID=3239887 RepID=UPI003D8BF34A